MFHRYLPENRPVATPKPGPSRQAGYIWDVTASKRVETRLAMPGRRLVRMYQLLARRVLALATTQNADHWVGPVLLPACSAVCPQWSGEAIGLHGVGPQHLVLPDSGPSGVAHRGRLPVSGAAPRHLPSSSRIIRVVLL